MAVVKLRVGSRTSLGSDRAPQVKVFWSGPHPFQTQTSPALQRRSTRGRGALGKTGFCFESSQLLGLKLHFMRKAFVLRVSCFFFVWLVGFFPQQQEFLSCCFRQPGKARNCWWGARDDLRAGWQDILFLPPAVCRARRMFWMGSKDTLLDPDCAVSSGTSRAAGRTCNGRDGAGRC